MSLNSKWSWIPSLLVVVGMLMIASCKDDEKPKSGISFELDEQSIAESDGNTSSFHPQLFTGAVGRDINIKLVLDRPLSETAVISYSIAGTATKNTAAVRGDFEVKGNPDFITLGPGATEATITITVFEDFTFEFTEEDEDGNYFETVILTLQSVVSGPIQIGEQSVFTLYIYEDDTLIFLEWDDAAVDLDLLLWLDNPSTTEEDFVYLTGSFDGDGFEGVSVPAGYYNTKYGMSYTYYSYTGSASGEVSFDVDIINFGGTLNGGGSVLSFSETYTLDNINEWDNEDTGEDPQIIQTMVKNQLNYTSVSGIVKPTAGSRIRHLKGAFESDRSEIRKSLEAPKFTLPRQLSERLKN